ncbi:MAG: HAMP domain-containing histidine kinase [Clostridia bacterium]|nr:HAMP domain-containing histidine kinase [Clostridia bacterium]
MNKKTERQSRIALTLLLAGVTFAVELLFLLLMAAIVITLSGTGVLKLEITGAINRPLLIALFVLFCLIVGAGISFLLSRILTGPINKTINTINRLAEGDYKARLAIGKPLSSHPTIIEITDSFNQMAARLDKTEILRTDFVNNFSHEFKTPIVSIMGFAKLLKRGNLTPEEQREYIDVIEEESGRLSNMAAGILQLSKIETQNVLGPKRRYNLSEQLRNCVLLLEKKWTEKGLEPELVFDEYEIEADEDLLKQVWLNLIDNAVKFSEPDCAFRILIENKSNAIQVHVANTGPDIPTQSLPYIFDKFYQADESHSGRGNGIGLAVVKRIVRLHGGEVGVQSGGGKTEFTVTIPQ